LLTLFIAPLGLAVIAVCMDFGNLGVDLRVRRPGIQAQ